METDEGRKERIQQIIETERRPPLLKRKSFWIAAVAAVLILLWAAMSFMDGSGSQLQYRTEKVKRGNVTVTVTATGTLEPLNQVDVGTEVSGTVEVVEADYNDKVQKDQVLARLDTSKLDAQVLQSRASVESARAMLLDAEATQIEARNEYHRLKKAWDLSGGRVPSENELATAEANLKRAESAEASAKAQVGEAEARLSLDETTLSKAIIRSPIRGIVLKRNVEPGQTVAASLQTPVLFTLAEDLAQMELQVDVDEADIGKVLEGQDAAFTVDAYPEKKFEASVSEVRFSPQSLEGVVTYQVLLTVDNTSLLLRPGMTATADVTIKEIKDVLLAPNAALRFSPPAAPEKQQSSTLLGRLFRRPSRPRSINKEEGNRTGKRTIWTLREKQPVSMSVNTGATDGMFTEVSGEGIAEGLEVVVSASEGKK